MKIRTPERREKDEKIWLRVRESSRDTGREGTVSKYGDKALGGEWQTALPGFQILLYIPATQ